ncbi:MAG: sulfotransferase [Acidimicrobiia bacterium]
MQVCLLNNIPQTGADGAKAQRIELLRWQNAQFWRPGDTSAGFASYNNPAQSTLPIIAIGASDRSGTTLFRNMLGAHPHLSNSPETLLFLPKPISEKLSERLNIPEDVLQEIFATHDSRAMQIDAIARERLKQSGKSIWVDKTSRNVHCFKWILDHFPNAKVLHMSRDPLDSIASLRTHPKMSRDGSGMPTGFINPLEDCLGMWLRAQEAVKVVQNDPRYLAVQYEDLIADPENILRDTCDFLGIKFDEAMLDHSQHVKDDASNPQKFTPNNAQAREKINPKRVGTWTENLKRGQALEILERTADYKHLYRQSSLELLASLNPVTIV